MLEIIKSTGQRNLIIFVHGFRGGLDSWRNANGTNFPQLLAENSEITSRYDIAVFDYYTRFLSLFSKSRSIKKLINSILNSGANKKRLRNVSVEEISEIFRSEIKSRCRDYESIILIGHSMGGLVCKSAIVNDWLQEYPTKIKLFISLAVPHQGAELAGYGKIVTEDVQIENLAPMNKFITTLSNNWLQFPSRPETVYCYAASDLFVKKDSAAPEDYKKKRMEAFEDDHTSIAKPANENSPIYVNVCNIINSFSTIATDVIELQNLSDDKQYDDRTFVVKLLIGDVHQSAVKEAKELFLNAEYMRKIFSNDYDVRKIEDLYTRIRTVYKNCFGKFLHDGIENSGMLLAEVHEKIIELDGEFLLAHAPAINGIHKKGMLHQLADDEGGDIWWTKDGSMEKIKAYLESI